MAFAFTGRVFTLAEHLPGIRVEDIDLRPMRNIKSIRGTIKYDVVKTAVAGNGYFL